MSQFDFSDAKIKLVRAEHHIKNLEQLIHDYSNSKFYKFELETLEGRVSLLFKSLHIPDLDIKSIIGDAISNIRSSLDYAAVAMLPSSINVSNV